MKFQEVKELLDKIDKMNEKHIQNIREKHKLHMKEYEYQRETERIKHENQMFGVHAFIDMGIAISFASITRCHIKTSLFFCIFCYTARLCIVLVSYFPVHSGYRFSDN